MQIWQIVISFLAGGVLGAVIIWLIWSGRKYRFPEFLAVKNELKNWETKFYNVQDEKNSLDSKLEWVNESLSKQEIELRTERELSVSLRTSLEQMKGEYKQLQEKLNTHNEDLEKLNEKFTKEFENVANKLLDEKANKINVQQNERLGEILSPFKEKIKEFEKKVDETHKENLRENTTLKQQINNLHKLNLNIGEEAKNLTKALKGDVKTQGNWGEIILERVLESSGLQKGLEYVTQPSITEKDGKRYQPDVLINLPDNKHLVIDAKVSLVHYEQFIKEDDKKTQDDFLKLHITSVKTHIKQLSEKNYPNLVNVNSPDFVLMFVPVESSFSLTLKEDHELYDYGWKRRIIMVGPSTLLATLKVIGSVWKQEKQNRNAFEIAKQAGALHDKFVSFTEDLIKVGQQLDKSKAVHDEAMKKIYSGKDNLIRKVERIKELGAPTQKTLSSDLVEKAHETLNISFEEDISSR